MSNVARINNIVCASPVRGGCAAGNNNRANNNATFWRAIA